MQEIGGGLRLSEQGSHVQRGGSLYMGRLPRQWDRMGACERYKRDAWEDDAADGLDPANGADEGSASRSASQPLSIG
jgi:hypothetical protein